MPGAHDRGSVGHAAFIDPSVTGRQAPSEVAIMSRTSGRRQATTALSDGTGLTQEELWLLAAAVASLAVLRTIFRTVDFVMDLGARPRPG